MGRRRADGEGDSGRGRRGRPAEITPADVVARARRAHEATHRDDRDARALARARHEGRYRDGAFTPSSRELLDEIECAKTAILELLESEREIELREYAPKLTGQFPVATVNAAIDDLVTTGKITGVCTDNDQRQLSGHLYATIQAA